MTDSRASTDTARDEIGEEGDVCRVCRVEGDEDDPLIYPCKCSGSVRYVHPSCFKNWLAHSQKQRCEICGHPYTFSKIYQSYIPLTIPFVVYIRQAGLFLQRIAYTVIRVELAILAWLVILPSCNMFSLQGVIWMSDQLPWSFTSRSSDGNSSQSDGAIQNLVNNSFGNATIPENLQEQITQLPVLPRLMTGVSILLERLFRLFTFAWFPYPEEEEFSAVLRFLVRGQLLTIVLAAAVFGVMVLRTILEENAFGRDFGPAHTELDDPMNPDEWVIRNGVAHKKDEANPETAPLQLDEQQKEKIKKLVVYMDTRVTLRTRKTDAGVNNAANEDRNGEETVAEAGEGEADQQDSWTDGITIATELNPDAVSSLGSGSNASHDPSEHEEVDYDATRSPPGPLFKHPAWSVEVTASSSTSGRDAAPVQGEASTSSESSPALLEGDDLQSIIRSLAMTPPRPSTALHSPIGVEYRAPELLGEEEEASLLLSVKKEKGKERASEPPDANNFEAKASDTIPDTVDGIERDSPHSNDIEGEVANGDVHVAPVQVVRDEVRAGIAALRVEAENRLEADRDNRARLAEVDDDADAEFAEEGDWMWDDAGGDGFWAPVMEVIGIIGPWSNLLQNLMICIVIGSAAITLLVGIPLMIGKTLLAADFVRSLWYSCRLVIKGTRLVTDPVIDISTEILRDVVAKPAMLSFHALERIIADKLGLQSPTFDLVPNMAGGSSHSWELPGVSTALDLLALLGNRTYKAYNRYRKFAMHAAFSPNLASRLWCLAAGYAGVVASFGSITLLGELGGPEGELGRSIAFIKVAIFTILDAVILPFLLGCSIDFYTIPLFSEASIWTRINWFKTSPGSACFIHLFVGSTFTYYFVLMLLWIRGDIRRGALYWMLDPRDPKFSLTKQLLEKSTWWSVQRRFSIVKQHLIVQFWLFGAWCWGLKLLGMSSLPGLRLSAGPISSVPFDLLFIHLAIPPSIKALRSQPRLRYLYGYVFRRTVALFGLTALVYGKRRAQLRLDPPAWLEALWKPADIIYRTLVENYDPVHGGTVRVPSSSVTFENVYNRKPDKRGAFIPLDETGAPRTLEDKIRLLRQDRLIRSKGRDPKTEFTVLTIPPYWLARVWALIYLSIITMGVGVGIMTMLPVVMGRAAFDILGVQQIHDGYSFFIGCYILWFIAKVSRKIRRRVVQNRRAGVLRRSAASTYVKRALLSWANRIYVFAVLFGVLPVLVGLCIELHVGLLVRYGLVLGVKPVIHFWDAWAMGLVTVSILVGVVEMYRPRILRHRNTNSTLTRLWQLYKFYRRPAKQRGKEVTKAVLPLAGWALLYIVVPVCIAIAMALLNHARPSTVLAYAGISVEDYNSFMFRLIFPTSTLPITLVLARSWLSKRWTSLQQYMIDNEYVVEMRVENYEPGKDAAAKTSEDQSKSEADGVIDGVDVPLPESEDESDEWQHEDEGERERGARVEVMDSDEDWVDMD